MKTEMTFTLNGSAVKVTVESHFRLIDLLRRTLGMTGTKEGCGEGECGSCTVIVDGQAVNSCLYPALDIEGKDVITVEGLQDTNHELSTIQKAFVDGGAIQCGFCTPGIIMSTKALLDSNPDPSEDEIRQSLQGHLCRCTGYVQIIEAVRKASDQMKREQ